MVTMGKQWAHSELLSQGGGLSVVGFSCFDVLQLVPRRNVAKKVQGIRLVTAFLVLTGERQRVLGEGVRLLQAAGQHLRFAQGAATERLKACRVGCRGLFHCLVEERSSVGATPNPGIRRP